MNYSLNCIWIRLTQATFSTEFQKDKNNRAVCVTIIIRSLDKRPCRGRKKNKAEKRDIQLRKKNEFMKDEIYIFLQIDKKNRMQPPGVTSQKFIN